MAVVKLGRNCRLYYSTTAWNGTDFAGSSFDEALNIRDLKLNIPNSEQDATTRGSQGWKQSVAILKEASIEFDLLRKDNDAFYEAVRDAWLCGDALVLAVMDGDADVVGTEGLVADVAVLDFARNEALNDPVGFSITCKPTPADYPPSWVEVTAA